MSILVSKNTKVICQVVTGLNVIPANDLDDAAKKIVKAVKEGG